jgi:hypothetical protein
MNSRQKGRNAENEFKQILIDRGYKPEDIEQVKGSSMWNKNVDLWGCFDMAAFGEDHLLLIQVKSNSTAGAKKALSLWKMQHKKLSEIGWLKILLAVRKDGRGQTRPVWREIYI